MGDVTHLTSFPFETLILQALMIAVASTEARRELLSEMGRSQIYAGGVRFGWKADTNVERIPRR